MNWCPDICLSIDAIDFVGYLHVGDMYLFSGQMYSGGYGFDCLSSYELGFALC